MLKVDQLKYPLSLSACAQKTEIKENDADFQPGHTVMHEKRR